MTFVSCDPGYTWWQPIWNTGESVAFGDSDTMTVQISRAVVASAALPGLYAAVTIGGQPFVDGALIRTMHASLALEPAASW